MSTRSGIGIMVNGNIHGIYCHSDGYVSYNGYLLHHFYQNEEKVLALVKQGDMSVLGMDIGYKIDFNERMQYVTLAVDEDAVKAKSVAQQCRFYARDRGEKTPHGVYGSEIEFERAIDGEYFYLFKHGEWLVSKGNGFVPLSSYFIKEEVS